MKNKQGFTLVELLSAIVLLGIIITIGIFSVSSIRNSILEKQYQNVKAEIELAAEKYYQNTESKEVYVETLINEGYLKADNKSMIITDPRNNKSLNCYVVTIDNEENATLGTDNSDENGKCTDASITNKDIVILDGDENPISNNWYKNAIVLKAKLNNPDKNKSDYNFTWKRDLNPNTINNEDTYNLNDLYNEIGKVINDVFYVSATNKTNSLDILDSVGKRVKIDGVLPEIKSLEIPDKDTWTKTKILKVNLTDIGSGIDGYILSEISEKSENDCETESLDNYKKIGDVQNPNDVKIEYTITKNGTYTFCAIDKAGNKVKYGENIVIDKVDDIPPKCDYEENTNWTKSNVAVSFGCTDKESGCAKLTYKNKVTNCNGINCYNNYTYSSTYKTANINNTIGSFIIEDNAGNITNCPDNDKKEVDVYLDKNGPEITNINITSTKSGYNSKYAKVSFTLYDEHSGISGFCIGPKKTNCSPKNLTYCSQNGNKYNCSIDYTFTSRDGSGTSEYVYITAYDNVVDKVKNSSTESKSYRLYESCTYTNFSRYGKCSEECDGGVYYEYRTDKYLGTSCNGYGNTSCNTMDCCSWTYQERYSTGYCDASCGWGSQRITYKIYSRYDDSYCGRDYDYEDCYDDSDCYEPDPDPDYGGGGSSGGSDCDTINDNRCDRSTDTLYWISDCCDGKCNYAAMDGSVAYGTISRSRLSAASNCSSYGAGGGGSSGGGGGSSSCPTPGWYQTEHECNKNELGTKCCRTSDRLWRPIP